MFRGLHRHRELFSLAVSSEELSIYPGSCEPLSMVHLPCSRPCRRWDGKVHALVPAARVPALFMVQDHGLSHHICHGVLLSLLWRHAGSPLPGNSAPIPSENLILVVGGRRKRRLSLLLFYLLPGVHRLCPTDGARPRIRVHVRSKLGQTLSMVHHVAPVTAYKSPRLAHRSHKSSC